MNKGYAHAWDVAEKVAHEIDPEAALTRIGHYLYYGFSLADGTPCKLWVVIDTPRYCLSVDGVSVRLHASELIKPVAEAIAASGVKPSWQEESYDPA
jgi:hypothetical protein